MTIRNTFVLGLLGLVAYALPAAAGGIEKTVTIYKTGGSVAFAPASAGKIQIVASAPVNLTVKIVGPRGVLATQTGPGPLTLVTEATAADIESAKPWAVQIAASGEVPAKGVTVQLRIESSGTLTTDTDLLHRITELNGGASRTVIAAPATTAAVKAQVVRSGAIPAFVPRPPMTSMKASVTSTPSAPGDNNYGGTTSTPATAQTIVPITGVQLTDPDLATRTCNGVSASTCRIRRDDIVDVKTAGGLSSLSHEVHVVYFDTNEDITVAPATWTDTDATFVMPAGLAHAEQAGAIYLGTPNTTARSGFWGFVYDKTILMWLPFEQAHYGDYSSSHKLVYSTTDNAGELITRGPADNLTHYSVQRTWWLSSCNHDIAFYNITLPSGWTVKKAFLTGWTAGLTNFNGNSALIVEQHPGSNNAQVGIDWCADAATTLAYKVGLQVEGPDGTTPW